MPHLTPEQQKMLGYILCGSLAALVGSMSKSRTLTLPRIMRERLSDGEIVRHVDVGFLVAPAAGALIAAIMDTNPINALGWGLAVGFGGPAVVNAVFDGILKRLGLDVQQAPPASAPASLSKETPNA